MRGTDRFVDRGFQTALRTRDKMEARGSLTTLEYPPMTRLIVLLRTVAITLVLGAAWLAPAAAEESAKTRPERGHDLYRVYCINCHGVEARGDGPIAELLRVKPADLTAIARENDGAFPAYAVYRQIDGRTPDRRPRQPRDADLGPELPGSAPRLRSGG